MLRLKLQYFGHLMRTANSREKSLMLGKIEGRRRGRHQGMRWLDGITNAVDMNFGKLWETVRDREVWCAWVHKELDMTGRLNNKVLFTQPHSSTAGGSLHTRLFLSSFFTVTPPTYR